MFKSIISKLKDTSIGNGLAVGGATAAGLTGGTELTTSETAVTSAVVTLVVAGVRFLFNKYK